MRTYISKILILYFILFFVAEHFDYDIIPVSTVARTQAGKEPENVTAFSSFCSVFSM